MTDCVQIISCDFSKKSHRTALVDLMNEYITDKMGGGEPYTDIQKQQLINGLANHPSKLVYLAVADNRFIGLANCYINFATFTVRPFVNVHDVIVTKNWRNKGIGEMLLKAIIDKAEELKCSKVTLEVREDNMNAKHLYNKLGFTDAEPRQFYWTKYI